jgi:hypothetical protein
VDDPEIHPRDPVWVRSLLGPRDLYLDLSSDVDTQPSTICEQGDRSDRGGRIRDLAGEIQLKRFGTAGCRNPQMPSVED